MNNRGPCCVTDKFAFDKRVSGLIILVYCHCLPKDNAGGEPMDQSVRKVTIAVTVALQDAGEATRSLEIMNAVRNMTPQGVELRAVFFSHGSKFEPMIRDNGYEILRVDPPMEGEGYLADLQPTAVNFVGTQALGTAMIRGELKALRELKPDFMLYGFWPFAGIARRILDEVPPGIRFLPLPLHPDVFAAHLLTDIPDMAVPLALLPASIRRRIARAIPARLILKLPIYRQTNLAGAAAECGWRGEPLKNLFEMLEADLTLVNDFSGFYSSVPMPKGFVVTGPVYAAPKPGDTVDPIIKKVFRRDRGDQVNLFVTMGSSAQKRFLIEAAHAVKALPEDRFRAVILAPKAVCPMKEILDILGSRADTYVTDRFVPAALVSALADITISHGGQGTVQTAMVCGTPIVGFAMQPEQQINLDHAVLQGAAIRIPKFFWNRRAIEDAVLKVCANGAYRQNAGRLGRMMALEDGRKKSADAIWAFIAARAGHKEAT